MSTLNIVTVVTALWSLGMSAYFFGLRRHERRTANLIRTRWCFSCDRQYGRMWGRATPHNTVYAAGTRACNPLCEDCWAELVTPEARLPYYRELYDWWYGERRASGVIPDQGEWNLVEAAVRAGR